MTYKVIDKYVIPKINMHGNICMRYTSDKCTKIYHNISFQFVLLLFLPNSFSFTNFVHFKDKFP